MKTREQITDAMLKVLSTDMAHPYIKHFHSDARLVEDLALDSSLILQFIMFLELEHNLEIPEAALMKGSFDTVRELTQIIYEAQGLPEVEKGLEVYEDLKIHCVLSCLSEVIKRRSDLDHRILYFSVWDAEVCVSDDCVLSYHSDDISHTFFTDWYEKIYGIQVSSWYDFKAPKSLNLDKLIELVETKKSDQHVMVMLDMFLLPERENKFNKDPFPHYVMLGATTDPDLWMMYDPDYRWEGVISKQRILNAVNQTHVAGGFMFSDLDARPTDNETIRDYIDASVNWDANPLTDAVRSIVTAHLSGQDRQGRPLALSALNKALEELPVLQVRKYGYEHAFAFFWRELGLPEAEFNALCDDIDELTKAYKVIQLQAMKLSATGKVDYADRLFEQLEEQDKREFELKRRLRAAYQHWLTVAFSQAESPEFSEV